MARYVASRSMIAGRDHAWYFGAVRPSARSAAVRQRNRVVVLAVHGHERAAAPGRGEHAEELPIVEMQRVVGQEHLEAADAGSDDLGHLAEDDVIGGIGDDLVEAVVHHRRRRAPPVLRERRAEALSLELGRERDDRGRAAGEGGPAAGDERLLVGASALLQLLDVAVGVDAPGHHEQAAGVERAGAAQVHADGRDPPGADADVGAQLVGGGHHGAAGNHQVVVGHGCLLADPRRRSLRRVPPAAVGAQANTRPGRPVPRLVLLESPKLSVDLHVRAHGARLRHADSSRHASPRGHAERPVDSCRPAGAAHDRARLHPRARPHRRQGRMRRGRVRRVRGGAGRRRTATAARTAPSTAA